MHGEDEARVSRTMIGRQGEELSMRLISSTYWALGTGETRGYREKVKSPSNRHMCFRNSLA